jgi:hypothetical protein
LDAQIAAIAPNGRYHLSNPEHKEFSDIEMLELVNPGKLISPDHLLKSYAPDDNSKNPG